MRLPGPSRHASGACVILIALPNRAQEHNLEGTGRQCVIPNSQLGGTQDGRDLLDSRFDIVSKGLNIGSQLSEFSTAWEQTVDVIWIW